MTLTMTDYKAARVMVVAADDMMLITTHAYAVFWQGAGHVRMLLFGGEYLVWTQRCDTRGDAIDAAFAAARREGFR